MAKSALIAKPQAYKFQARKFVNADGTGSFLVATIGANDSIIKTVNISSDDSGARVVQLFVKKGGVEYLIDSIPVPAGAGSDGVTPAVNALISDALPKDRVDKAILPLEASLELFARVTVAVTAAKTITVSVIQEDF